MSKNNVELMDPKVDFVFKLIFGNEKDTSFLISFLNALLKLEGEKEIKSVIIMNPNNSKNTANDKYSILDVKAKTNEETIVNIEIQLKNEHNMRLRTIYYLSKMIAERLKEGENYRTIYKTVAINILNFDIFEKSTRFHNTFHFMETETKKELSDVAEIHFVELTSLRRYIEQNKENVEKTIEKDKLLEWLLFIDNPESEFAKMAQTSNQTIGRAKDMLKTLSSDEKLREEYLAREKALLDYYSAFDEAQRRGEEKGFEIGKEKGIEIGKEKGIEIGKEEGIEIGRTETLVETAKEMFRDDASIQMVKKYTKLSEEMLLKIKKEVDN